MPPSVPAFTPISLPTPTGQSGSNWNVTRPGSSSAGMRRPPSSPALRKTPPKRHNLAWALLILGALVGSILFSLHVYVMPLPVAAVYLRPAFVDVTSEPAGADIYVDGLKVLGTTPAVVEVHRDHREHHFQVRKEGFLPSTAKLRYDREVRLEVSFRLQPAPRPPVP
jgi:hypothetical protein